MDRRQESPFGVGIITIITVLLVLTLAINLAAKAAGKKLRQKQ